MVSEIVEALSANLTQILHEDIPRTIAMDRRSQPL